MKKKSEFWKEIPLGEFPSKCSESKNTSDISISYSHILNVLVELSWEQKLKKAKSWAVDTSFDSMIQECIGIAC